MDPAANASFCKIKIICVLSFTTGLSTLRVTTLREISIDTLVSTLTRRGRYYRGRLVSLRLEKQGYFSENPT